ncbi:MAG: peptide chain release factor N(5)-glutamine methyltransferase [Gammaproteobacteria bacterium]|nr:peptide chain release factor N(5)-glutamine methyltransferase [Gammaproteobacteria bacterium]
MTSIGHWMSTANDLPRLDRERILTKVLGLTRSQIIASPETEISLCHQSQLDENTHRLRKGTPMAYILGTMEFWGLAFKVTPQVLIPRPDTELLVEKGVELAPPKGRVLELGTGSGAISIAMAKERRDLTILATDSSAQALEIARYNASSHAVDITFAHSDWFTSVQGKWDLIISNPPYIASNDPHLAELAAEPFTALVSGEEGLDDLTHIIDHAIHHLNTDGYLLLEHGYDQAAKVREVMCHAGLIGIRSHRDLANIERVSIGQLGPANG